jgi:hypothetical protein
MCVLYLCVGGSVLVLYCCCRLVPSAMVPSAKVPYLAGTWPSNRYLTLGVELAL